MTRKERDPLIAKLYTEGSTQGELAERFQLSEPRIGQILARAGLVPADRPRISSDRTEYMGFQLSPLVKQALRDATEKRISMSLFIAQAVEEKLKREGISVQPAILEELNLLRLPFDEEAILP
jgi:hypothetical protein